MKANHIHPGITQSAASSRDMDRVFRALERLGIWECPCCKELDKQPDHREAHLFRPLGVCQDCFLTHEDITPFITLPPCDHDIYVFYSRLMSSGSFFNHFGPYGNRSGLDRPPVEYDIVSVFIPIIGEERMREIIIEHRGFGGCFTGSGPRAFFDPSSVRWHKDYGFIPVAHGDKPEDFPAKSNHKAWDAMRSSCWILDPDPDHKKSQLED